MDAVSRNIGTELLFENDRIRVWDMTLEPGQSSELHQHVNDYGFVYVTADNRLEVRESGREPTQRAYDDKFVQYVAVGEEGLVPHRLTNVGQSEHRQVLVEFLGESASSQPLPAETNDRFLD